MRSFLALCLIATLFAIVGCQKKDASAESDKVMAVVRAQVDALNQRNLNDYLATIDPQSPGFAQTSEVVAKLFATYDLRYKLNEARVDSVSGDEAKVKFSQDTTRIAGPAFRDNRLKGTHVLKKRDGAWKFYNTTTESIEYLESNTQ